MASIIRTALMAIVLSVASAPAYAITDTNRLVNMVGIQGNTIIVSFTVPPSATCPGNQLSVDLTSSSATAQYLMGLLMTAKATNKPISRVDYSILRGTCLIDSLQW